MSEIKFRAWDSKKKVWTNYQIVDDMIYFMDKFTGVWLRDADFKRFKLVQYTGLKDKNGKEIYEGDILHVEQQSRGTIDQFIPHKRSVAVRYEAKDTAYVFDEEHGQAIGLYTITDELEVIGNIYEDPELMQEGKS